MAATCWCHDWDLGWKLAGVVLDSLESLRSVDAVGGANNAGSCSYPSTVHHRPDEPTGAVLPPEALEKADLVIARLWQWTRKAIVWGVEPAGMTGPWLDASPRAP